MKRTFKKLLSLMTAIVFVISALPAFWLSDVEAVEENWYWPIEGFYNLSGCFSSSHRGIDIASSGIKGATVRAAKSGTVYQSYNGCPHVHVSGVAEDCGCYCVNSMGNFVWIKHDDGTGSRYMHLEQGSAIAAGTRVEQGDPIGKVSSSGYSSGYHLHFEILSDYKDITSKINTNPTDSRHTGSSGTPSISYIYNSNSSVIKNSTVTTGDYRLKNGSSYLTADTALNSNATLKVSALSSSNAQIFNIFSHPSYGTAYMMKPLSNSSGRVNVWCSTNSTDGAKVTLYENTEHGSQTWVFEKKDDAYLIHPYDNTTLSLTNSNGSVYVKNTTGDGSQLWYLESAQSYTGTTSSSDYVMTADEFVDCLKIALSRKTGYWSKYPYNLGYYDGDTIYWDCSNLGKSIIWSKGTIVNNYTKENFQRVDTSCGLGDWNADTLYQNAPNPSSDFKSILPGEWLYMKGHIGYYIGGGQVIECTTGWDANAVIQSQVDQYGNRSWGGKNNGTWICHWKSPWIDYSASSETSSVSVDSYYLNVNGVQDGTLKDDTNGYGTFDVYINGSRVANNVTDYYKQWPKGTSYEIKDINTKSGKTYNGAQKTPLSGTVSAYTEINLEFSTVQASSTIADGLYTLSPLCAPNARLDSTDGKASEGSNVVINDAGNHAAQTFCIRSLGNGYYTLAAGNTSVVLDVFDANAEAGTNVQLMTYTGTDAQQWAIVALGNDYYEIVPKINLELSLDVDYARSESGTNVKLWDSNGTNAQMWKLVPTDSIGGQSDSDINNIDGASVNWVDIHFEHRNVYREGQFSDVYPNQWFTDSVADAYEIGLMQGNSKDTFNPYGDVTIAEAVTIAARMYPGVYETGELIPETPGKWYQKYMDYAYSHGIIDSTFYTCDATQKATRAEVAQIFASAMYIEAFRPINYVADGAIPDVRMDDTYADAIYRLYRAGILTGSDANGTFNAETYITRAEISAIISCMAESGNRVSLTLG